MVDNTDEVEQRSYGCSYGCGNPYDFIVVMVRDAETQMLCVPCFIRTAMDMVSAIVEPDNPDVQQRVMEAPAPEQVPMNGRQVAARGHEAPVDSLDPDAIGKFEGYVLSDEIDDFIG